jgi:hypothetical protein
VGCVRAGLDPAVVESAAGTARPQAQNVTEHELPIIVY